MCSSCWKIGRNRTKESVIKQKNTNKQRYGNHPPGGFVTGKHSSPLTEFKKGYIPLPNRPVHRGTEHPMYIDGRTPLRHKLLYMPKYTVWRTEVFIRDKFTCQSCGCKGDIEAHHLVPVIHILRKYNINTLEEAEQCSELWNVNNGKTLCRKCHKFTIIHHRTRDESGRFEKIRS